MKSRLYNMETSFVLQVVILACVLSILAVVVVQKRASKTPYEITYRHQLIEKAVYDLHNNAIVITDANNKILLWNKGAEKLFGWKEDEVNGKDLTMIQLLLPEVNLKDTPIDTEAMHRLQSTIPISLTVSESKVGNVTHYTAVMKSISKRKETEAVHLREIQLLNEGEEIACFGSWSWAVNSPDMVTDRVMVTDGFRRLFETEDAFTDVQLLMNRVYHEDAPRVFAVLKKAQEEKSDYKVEYRILKKNGRLIWINCIGKIYLTENGNIEKIVGTIQQIQKNV